MFYNNLKMLKKNIRKTCDTHFLIYYLYCLSLLPDRVKMSSSIATVPRDSVANDKPSVSTERLNCCKRFQRSLYSRRSFGYSPSNACFKNEEAAILINQSYAVIIFYVDHIGNCIFLLNMLST